MSEVLATLEQLDASVEYDENGQVSRVVLVGQHVGDAQLKVLGSLSDSLRRLNLISTSVEGPGLAHLRGMARLERLDLGANPELTDLGLAYLKGLTKLETLRLWDTNISDKGMELISELKQLRWLYLGGTTITDAGLSFVKKLTLLRGLDLRATHISDRGLKPLNALQNLEWLDLSETPIDGSGLSYISGLPYIGRVHLRHTQLEPNALLKFKRHQPKCVLDTLEAASAQ